MAKGKGGNPFKGAPDQPTSIGNSMGGRSKQMYPGGMKNDETMIGSGMKENNPNMYPGGMREAYMYGSPGERDPQQNMVQQVNIPEDDDE